MAFRLGDPGGRVYGAVGAANANLIAYWTSFGINVGTMSVSAGTGRTGNSSLRYNGGGASNWVFWLGRQFESQQTWGVAFAFKPGAIPSTGSTTNALVSFYDSTSLQCDLRLNTNGTLNITRNGTVLGTSTYVLSINNWVHIEFMVKVDPSVGTAQLWLNGAIELNLTSQNTRATTNSSANLVRVGLNTNNIGYSSFGGNTNFDYDDIIVYDGQTTDPAGNPDITGPIGDCSLAWLLPTAAGSSTQYTPDSGSNYARVADPTIDTTSYVESSTVNNIDSYAMADLPAGASLVKTAAVVSYVRKTDTGSRGAKNLIRTAGTNYPHTNEISLSDSYLYYFHNWGSNPNTAGAWAVSEVNSLEVGQKVSS